MSAAWDELFAAGAAGYRESGRGVVYVHEWTEVPRYVAKSEAAIYFQEPNLVRIVESYDPRRQIVVVIRRVEADGAQVFTRYELTKSE